MAKKTKLTVIDPNGVKHHRTTARTYTHAILVREDFQRALDGAKTVHPVEKKNFDWEVKRVAENDFGDWYTEEKKQAARDRTAGHTWETWRDHLIATRLEKLAKDVDAGRFQKWGVACWCGRPDLAQAQLTKHQENPYFVQALAVQIED